MSDIEKYKVGEYGLEESTYGMYARCNDGIIGYIINANSDEMINGPEIKTKDCIYCVERDGIVDIQDRRLDLLKLGDYIDGYVICDFWLEPRDKTRKKAVTMYGDYDEDEIVNVLTEELYNKYKLTLE